MINYNYTQLWAQCSLSASLRLLLLRTSGEHVPDDNESHVVHNGLKIAVLDCEGGRMDVASVLNTGSGNLAPSCCDIGQLQLCGGGSSSLEPGQSQTETKEVTSKLQYEDETEEYDKS